MLSIQGFQLVLALFCITFNLMVPPEQDMPKFVGYAFCFTIGLIEGSNMLFVQLIGPLLVAANNRKTYEVTMGGTMIAVCTGLPFVIGSTIGTFLEALCMMS